jgi:hypothetical protein
MLEFDCSPTVHIAKALLKLENLAPSEVWPPLSVCPPEGKVALLLLQKTPQLPESPHLPQT